MASLCSLFPTGEFGLFGLYSGSANEFVEYDNSGAQIGRWRTPLIPENISVTGSAVTSAGDLYISGFTNQDGYKLFVYRFDKQTSVFLPVEIPSDTGSSRPLTIIGSDADEIVFYGKPTGLIWLELH